MTYDALTESEWSRLQHVWELLEDGALEQAEAELRAVAQTRPGHPDLRIVQAALALEAQEPEEALALLEGAERSADPAFFFHLRASAAYDLARFETALEDASRVLAIRDDAPETHELLSRVYEHLGDAGSAARHLRRGAELDPAVCPLPLHVPDDEFDELVERSVAELPPQVRTQLDETPIVVESLPTREMLQAGKPTLSPDLLGLFAGRDLLGRSFADVPGTPGIIYLFRRNLLRMCRNREELAKEIRTTVLHEVAHLLGLDEDGVGEWGLA